MTVEQTDVLVDLRREEFTYRRRAYDDARGALATAALDLLTALVEQKWPTAVSYQTHGEYGEDGELRITLDQVDLADGSNLSVEDVDEFEDEHREFEDEHRDVMDYLAATTGEDLLHTHTHPVKEPVQAMGLLRGMAMIRPCLDAETTDEDLAKWARQQVVPRLEAAGLL